MENHLFDFETENICEKSETEKQEDCVDVNINPVIAAEVRKAERLSDIKYVIAFVSLVVAIIITNVFFFNVTLVIGSSMEPAFSSGSLIVVNKIAPSYTRYSIVMAETEEGKIVKRIIGMPGDTIQIKDGSVFINGEKAEDVIDEHIEFAGSAFTSLSLGEGEYFLLGDNRNNSMDSRYEEIGVIHESELQGEVCFCLWPIKNIN